jgi:ferredoxin--NADP+ reductase
MKQKIQKINVQKQESEDYVKVLNVTNWTKDLFSFELERPHSFRFSAGEFIMLGLQNDFGQPILRAYSIASPTWSDTLLFYSVNIKDGPLTSMLSKIKPLDKVILKRKPTGTLILDAIKPGKRLFLFSTGTGIAPFLSIIREPETYQRFDSIILTHTCRERADLGFSESILEERKTDEILSLSEINALEFYPTLTRDASATSGRITDLILSGKFFKDFNFSSFLPSHDRAMLCGSQNFNKQMKEILKVSNLKEGSINCPGDFVLEKAFVGE